MSGLTLDSGALIALDRNDRRVVALLARADEVGVRVTVPATALAQAIRQPTRQARLARLVRQPTTDLAPLDGVVRLFLAIISLALACGPTKERPSGRPDGSPDPASDGGVIPADDADAGEERCDGEDNDGDGDVDEGDVCLTVAIESGRIQGAAEGATRMFRGIPYAAPPLGDNRWRAPQSVVPWEGVRDTTSVRSVCPQPAHFATSGDELAGSEDCLYLNVWSPVSIGAAKPVIVFVGELTAGTRVIDGVYSGRGLAEAQDVVLVTLNYRLLQFGGLGLRELSLESLAAGGSEISGNYGQADILAALEWVQRNIEAFRGDPRRVTLMATSEGALRALALLAAPSADGLVHRAVLSSTHFEGAQRPLRSEFAYPECGDPVYCAETGEEFGERFVEQIGCAGSADRLACLRAKSTEEVFRTYNPAASNPSERGNYRDYHPMVDGDLLPEAPTLAFRAGRFLRIPWLVGTTGTEASIYFDSVPLDTIAQFETRVRTLYGSFGDRILSHYPVADDTLARSTFYQLYTDQHFHCRLRRAVNRALQFDVPIYRYLFSVVPSWAPARYGAWHASEVFYTMDGYEIELTPAELEVSSVARSYIGSFARDGIPTARDQVAWPMSVVERDTYLEFKATGDRAILEAGELLRTDACDFWDSLIVG